MDGTETNIADLYLVKGLGIQRISKETGVPKSTVYAFLVKQNIPRRKGFGGLFKHERNIGKRYLANGYVVIVLSQDDFFCSTANRKTGHIYEHRLVMAQHLGRNLHTWEIVHHKNHIKDDNRIGNLQLVSDDRHKQITLLEGRINDLEKQVRLLKLQIKIQNKLEV